MWILLQKPLKCVFRFHINKTRNWLMKKKIFQTDINFSIKVFTINCYLGITKILEAILKAEWVIDMLNVYKFFAVCC